jgi:hypothetical protein
MNDNPLIPTTGVVGLLALASGTAITMLVHEFPSLHECREAFRKVDETIKGGQFLGDLDVSLFTMQRPADIGPGPAYFLVGSHDLMDTNTVSLMIQVLGGRQCEHSEFDITELTPFAEKIRAKRDERLAEEARTRGDADARRFGV